MQADNANKQSRLLTYEENQQVFKLLGHNCLSLATAVIQLFETQAPNHSTWVRKDAGVLCFVKDNVRKNHFLRVYCMKLGKMIWEQELYANMEYIAVSSYLHTFEGDECIICFNFANDDEAKDMKQVVEAKLQAQRRRQAKRSRAVQENDGMQRNHVETLNNTVATKISSKDKRRKNLTKADIGVPLEFRHLSHVGWNPNTGFDVDTKDAALTELFAKAGISENQLKDKNTREFIYDFINKNDHQRIIQDEQVTKARRPPPAIPPQPPSISPAATSGQPGPPVPPRRSAPPPPPSVTQATPQHNSTPPRNNIPPPRPPTTPRIANAAKSAIPPPPPINAPAPPPPPMMPDMPMSPPPPPISRAPPVESQPDGRFVLMESIRSGTTLRPVPHEPAEKRGPDDARGDLLSEIRKGFQLKPANEREVKPISPAAEQQHNGVNDLAAALSRALAERSRAIQPDDDSDSSDSNDDWDE